jgi:N-acetylmuramic acid 6-phosphate etherase
VKNREESPSPAWSDLLTEGRHSASLDLDTRSTLEIVTLLLEEDRRGLDAALRQQAVIARAAEWVASVLSCGGDVVLAGAGTSGRLGIVEAAECPPTFGTDPDRIRAVIAGGPDAVFRAQEGAEDRGGDGAAAVAELGEQDLLIALSASSVTPFALGALMAARRQGARTVLLTCAAADGLADAADLLVALATGPEILTGSTRLKAGSATKAALNAITTAAMVRLGKIYENLMVDLRPGSAKLQDRARRIVAIAGRVDHAEAERLYEAAGGEVKTAIVMARLGVGTDEARARLAATAGSVRAALG